MFPSLPSSIDQLSSEGIVNFDSEAYIYGKTPRYVGAPHANGLPFEQPLNTYPTTAAHDGQGPQLRHQPSKDEYVHSKPSTSWKTWILGGIAATLATVVGIKYKDKIAAWITNKPVKKSKVKKSKKKAKAKKAKKAKAKANAAQAAAKTSWFSKARTTVVSNWNKLPKWGKITAGSIAGLLALTGIYKYATRNSAPELTQAPTKAPKTH